MSERALADGERPLNRRSSDRSASPKLVIFAGLPGTGKSTLARLLAERLDAIWLRVDTIEASLLKAGIQQSFETGLAAYVAACDIARDHLQLRHDAIVDAVNGVEPARQMWRELAAEEHARRYVVEVTCSDRAEHRRRVESREPPTPPLPKPTWQEVVEREYIAWDEPILTVDGLEEPSVNLSRIQNYIEGT
ncbi:MAG: AAA family ATPase [Thermoplasmata archaeon]